MWSSQCFFFIRFCSVTHLWSLQVTAVIAGDNSGSYMHMLSALFRCRLSDPWMIDGCPVVVINWLWLCCYVIVTPCKLMSAVVFCVCVGMVHASVLCMSVWSWGTECSRGLCPHWWCVVHVGCHRMCWGVFHWSHILVQYVFLERSQLWQKFCCGKLFCMYLFSLVSTFRSFVFYVCLFVSLCGYVWRGYMFCLCVCVTCHQHCNAHHTAELGGLLLNWHPSGISRCPIFFVNVWYPGPHVHLHTHCVGIFKPNSVHLRR